MSDSSSSDDEEFVDAVEKITIPRAFSLPNRKMRSSFSEDDLPQPQPATITNRAMPLTTTTPATQQMKESYHTRTNSNVSFEEWSYGRSSTSSYNCHSHTRVHSWSDGLTNKTSLVANLDRKSFDTNNRATALIVGIEHHPHTSETPPHGKQFVKIKTKIKTNKRFNRIVLAQTLAVETSDVYSSVSGVNKIKEEDGPKQPMGAIWAGRFSKDGKYMAMGGQTCVLNVWKVLRDLDRSDNMDIQDMNPHEPSIKVFHDVPVRRYTGHTADILDISWSKNNFIVTSSMDKTVRLWHISQNVCLCVFRHLDVVTSVKFHPKDDRFFLSGSLDCKVRLWSIPEKRVAFWNEIPVGNMVTAVGFTLDGRTACVGANTGDVFFFETQGLKYNTQILVKNSNNKRGRKVTGIEPMPSMPPGEERILVTTNDSRIWIVNMKDKSFVQKYKGLENSVMQIKASFSDDGRYIVSGSEDGCVYFWCTDQVNYSPFQYMQDSRIKAAVALGHLGDQMLHYVMQSNGDYSESQQGRLTGWLKKGERHVIDKLRSRDEHFLAHQHSVTATMFAPTKTRQQLAKAGGDIIFENTLVYTHKESNSDDNYSDYKDCISETRKSMASSFNSRRTSKHYNDMEELRFSLMNEFEEATPEERDQFKYPDSQIIISADLHGSIKVWRMDSGVYNNDDDEETDDTTTGNDYYPNKQLHTSVSSPDLISSNKKSRRSFSSIFFSKRN